MAARASMAALILRTRTMIGDPVDAGHLLANAQFTDEQVQGFLDNHRTEARLVELRQIRSVAVGGLTSYLEYKAPRGGWEDSALLQGNTYQTLTPATSDLIAGRWVFASSTNAPVFITGQVYDLYGAAVEGLMAMQSASGGDFDFAEDGQSFSRSQKGAGIAALISQYQRYAQPAGARLIESRWAW